MRISSNSDSSNNTPDFIVFLWSSFFFLLLHSQSQCLNRSFLSTIIILMISVTRFTAEEEIDPVGTITIIWKKRQPIFYRIWFTQCPIISVLLSRVLLSTPLPSIQFNSIPTRENIIQCNSPDSSSLTILRRSFPISLLLLLQHRN